MKNKLQKVGFALAGGVTTLVAMLPMVSQVQAETLKTMLDPGQFAGGNLGYTALINRVINLVFIIAAALTFFYLIFGAISWITSGGDKGKVEAARNKITAAVIGLLILAATWGIFTLLVQLFFNKNVTDIELPILKS